MHTYIFSCIVCLSVRFELGVCVCVVGVWFSATLPVVKFKGLTIPSLYCPSIENKCAGVRICAEWLEPVACFVRTMLGGRAGVGMLGDTMRTCVHYIYAHILC